ncbi:MAG: YcxB family protein [Chloroflexi bacterium]|nr:YcxB family protein [Chloroflexota bacterium]
MSYLTFAEVVNSGTPVDVRRKPQGGSRSSLNPSSTLVFSVNVSPEDLAVWHAWWYENRESRLTRWFGGYSLPIVALLLAATPPFTSASLSLKAGGIIALAALSFWDNLNRRKATRRELRKQEYTSEVGQKEYSVSSLEIVGRDETGETRSRWSDVREVAVTDNHIFVVLDTAGFILPLRQLDQSVRKTVVERGAGLAGPLNVNDETPEAPLVQARFEYHERDERNRVAPLFRLSRRQQAHLVGGGAFVGLIGVVATGRSLTESVAATLITCALGSGLTVAVALLMRWEGRRRQARRKDLGWVEAALTTANVRVRWPRTTERVAWTAVRRIAIETEGIRIEGGTEGGIYIPRHAFNSDVAYEDFYRQAEALQGASARVP